MIKILSSYKIIKNSVVIDDEDNLSVIDTKMDVEEILHPIIETKEESESSVELQSEPIVDLREEIRREISEEMEKECQLLLQKSHEEAEDIKARANQEGLEQGYETGFNQGYSEGMDKATREGQVIKDNAKSLIKQAEEEVQVYYQKNKDDILRLAGDMAENIVHHVIDTSSDNILLLVKPIIREYEKRENIIIRCNPANGDYVKTNLYQLENIGSGGRFIVLEDDTVEKNGAIIENDHQIIDLQIKKQIQSMIEDMKNME